MRVLVALTLALLAVPLLAGSVEEQIVARVDARNDAALALLERSVNINSGTMNLAGVREVGALFRAHLDELGFETRWVEGRPFGRAGHLLARRGATGRHVLLIGHLDTVFEPDSPFQAYERVDDSHARGPGTTDMKGGNVIIVHALAALKDAGLLDRLTVTVLLTGDEEKVGEPRELARQALYEAADAADVALGFEDGDGDPRTAVVARRGTSGWELRVKGTTAHSSQVFREDIGSGAIYEAARILDGFHEQLSGEPYLTFSPGLIVGGTNVEFDAAQARGTAFGKNNVIAEHATVSGDLRTLSTEQRERAKERMRAIVADGRPHTSAEIDFRDGYPPLNRTAGNDRLLALFDRVSRDLGFGPVTAVDPSKAGAADVSFAAGRVGRVMDGLGLMGVGGHTERETADLSMLPLQTKRVAVLLYRLSRED